jgi:AAA15 family ATPase/GTPase
MLINFSVENFRSFGAEQTLNLVAADRLQEHPDHRVPIADTGKSVLRASAVYGANAAGKSNLVRAIHFAQNLIKGQAKPLALSQFRFRKETKPSSFEFRILVDGQLFVYGFDVTQKSVVEEWLDATSAKGREVSVFHRTEQDIVIGDLKPFSSQGDVSGQALQALKHLGVRPDQLLLNKIVDLPASHRGDLLHKAAWWFSDCLTVVLAESRFSALIEFLNQEANFREFAGAFLQNVGTGINALRVERSEISADNIPKAVLEGLQGDGRESTIQLGDLGVKLQLDPNDPTKIIRRNLTAQHDINDSTYSLPFQDESDGTQRCLNLLPALYHLKTRCNVFVIDEINRSLHPLLCHAFLKFFVESCAGACQQMVVTTHETHLLDLDLLRRDEIWFVEKDEKQQTQVYSLADMKIRNDVRIEKGYLQGRFGGIPFIGDTQKLMDLIRCPSNGHSHAKETSS